MSDDSNISLYRMQENEIERLKAQLENCHAAKNLHAMRSEKLQADMAAKDKAIESLEYRNHRWQDDFNAQNIELAKWRAIAIEERAINFTAEAGIANRDDWNEDIVLNKDHYREIAAKELDLQIGQEASYVKRLEEDYLAWVQEYYRDLGEEIAIQKAQAALVKIRAGE
jgi:hypothetical protein